MDAYKLVVVGAFDRYRRGDQIFDQELVKRICDPNSPDHENYHHVRRVLMSESEKQQNIVRVQQNENSDDFKIESAPIHIESINDDPVDAA